MKHFFHSPRAKPLLFFLLMWNVLNYQRVASSNPPPNVLLFVRLMAFFAILLLIIVIYESSCTLPGHMILATGVRRLLYPELRQKLNEIDQTFVAMGVDSYCGTLAIRGPDGNFWAISSWGDESYDFEDTNFFVASDVESGHILHAKIGKDIKNYEEHTLESLILFSQEKLKYMAQGDAIHRRRKRYE